MEPILNPLVNDRHLPGKSFSIPFDINVQHIKSSQELSSLNFHMTPKGLKTKHARLESDTLSNSNAMSSVEGSFQNTYLSDKIVNHTLELSFDWIEEEMAKVCGEAMVNSDAALEKPVVATEKSNPPLSINQSILKGPDITCGGLKPAPPSTVGCEFGKPNATNVNWKLVRMKNEADLDRKLKRVEQLKDGAQKRIRLERRFNELFGPDESTKNSLDKRKDEIAAYTVKHLMPLYKKQRIASKDLFKKLAKHISTCIMEQLTSPSENDVQLKVLGFFSDGRCVNSDADIIL